MYSASTRATYADLCKTAAAGLPSRIGTMLVDAAHEHPIIAASLAAALGTGGGYALGSAHEKDKTNSMLQGIHMARTL